MKLRNVDPTPNFDKFLDTLRRRGWKRPPLFDFHIHDNHRHAILGRPTETAADHIAFFRAAGGYMPGVSNTVPDFVSLSNYVRMIETVYSYPDEPIG